MIYAGILEALVRRNDDFERTALEIAVNDAAIAVLEDELEMGENFLEDLDVLDVLENAIVIAENEGEDMENELTRAALDCILLDAALVELEKSKTTVL